MGNCCLKKTNVETQSLNSDLIDVSIDEKFHGDKKQVVRIIHNPEITVGISVGTDKSQDLTIFHDENLNVFLKENLSEKQVFPKNLKRTDKGRLLVDRNNESETIIYVSNLDSLRMKEIFDCSSQSIDEQTIEEQTEILTDNLDEVFGITNIDCNGKSLILNINKIEE